MIYGYIAKDFNSMDVLRDQVSGYAKRTGLSLVDIIEDPTSNKTHWKERALAAFLANKAEEGDQLVVYEASNIARSTIQVFEVLSRLVDLGIQLHFVKYNEVFTGERESDTKKLVALMQQIESDFVAKRTTEALARRREKGLPLGRPKGRLNKQLKLDKHRKDIQKYLDLGVSKASVAKIIGCHAQTLYHYVEVRKLKPRRSTTSA